jgi:hypothetical protein
VARQARALCAEQRGVAQASGVDPMDTVEMDRGTWMTMPFGWKISQVKAEQGTMDPDRIWTQVGGGAAYNKGGTGVPRSVNPRVPLLLSSTSGGHVAKQHCSRAVAHRQWHAPLFGEEPEKKRIPG